MIHIRLKNRLSIERWYADQITRQIETRILRIQKPKYDVLEEFCNKVKSLSGDTLTDVLTLPKVELEQKYTWLEEYGKLCDFAGHFKDFKKKTTEKKPRLEYAKKERLGYLKSYACRYIQFCLDETGLNYDSASQTWLNIEKVYLVAAELVKEIERLLVDSFNYELISRDQAEIKAELVKRLNLHVCPYCNRQYIQPVTIKGQQRYLADLDHVYAKHIYSLYSLSLWNLVPSCKVCNQMFKGRKVRHYLNPYEEGFNEDCYLALTYKNVNAIIGKNLDFDFSWKVDDGVDVGKRARITTNLKTFALDEVYEMHRENIRDILRKRYLYSSCINLEKILNANNLHLSRAEINRLIYGVSLSTDEMQNEMLSKMIQDVVRKN